MSAGPKIFTRLGVRYQCFETHGGRFGPGKVHLQYWSKEHQQWVLLCRPKDAGMFTGYYGSAAPELMEVTCKTCKKKDPR